jgi:energy-converting hydrogenase Eha subunit A
VALEGGPALIDFARRVIEAAHLIKRIHGEDGIVGTAVFFGLWTDSGGAGFLGAFPFPVQICFGLITDTGVALIVGGVGVAVFADGAISDERHGRDDYEDSRAFPFALGITYTGVTAVVGDFGAVCFTWLAGVLAADPLPLLVTAAGVAIVGSLYRVAHVALLGTGLFSAYPFAVLVAYADVA